MNQKAVAIPRLHGMELTDPNQKIGDIVQASGTNVIYLSRKDEPDEEKDEEAEEEKEHPEARFIRSLHLKGKPRMRRAVDLMIKDHLVIFGTSILHVAPVAFFESLKHPWPAEPPRNALLNRDVLVATENDSKQMAAAKDKIRSSFEPYDYPENRSADERVRVLLDLSFELPSPPKELKQVPDDWLYRYNVFYVESLNIFLQWYNWPQMKHYRIFHAPNVLQQLMRGEDKLKLMIMVKTVKDLLGGENSKFIRCTRELAEQLYFAKFGSECHDRATAFWRYCNSRLHRPGEFWRTKLKFWLKLYCEVVHRETSKEVNIRVAFSQTAVETRLRQRFHSVQ